MEKLTTVEQVMENLEEELDAARHLFGERAKKVFKKIKNLIDIKKIFDNI